MGSYRYSLIHRQTQAWLILLVVTIACSGVNELRCPACPTQEVSRVIDGDTFDSPVSLTHDGLPSAFSRTWNSTINWLAKKDPLCMRGSVSISGYISRRVTFGKASATV